MRSLHPRPFQTSNPMGKQLISLFSTFPVDNLVIWHSLSLAMRSFK